MESRTQIQLPTVFSDDFKNKIDDIGNSFISSAFKNLYNSPKMSDFTLISIGQSDDTITYVDSSKVYDYIKRNYSQIDPVDYLNSLINNKKSDINLSKLPRTEIKVGRFVNKFFPKTFTDKAVEGFVNYWKSTTVTLPNFEVWKGTDIKKAYKSNTYHFAENGNNPLMNSCMNDELILVDFYSYCPTCNVIVLLDDENNILGRALLWEDSDGRMIMDRVYYVYDKDYYKFIRLANDHGWYYKKRNISGGSSFIKNGQETSLKSKVRVPDVFKHRDEGFPYMDTFYYAQGEWAMNYEPEGRYFKLIDTDGSYEEYTDYESLDENLKHRFNI